MTNDEALAAALAVALDTRVPIDAMREAFQVVIDRSEDSDEIFRGAVMAGFRDATVRLAPTRADRAAYCAIMCGAMLEMDADATGLWESLEPLLLDALEQARAFAVLCRLMGEADESPDRYKVELDEDSTYEATGDFNVYKYGPVQETHAPELARAWKSLYGYCMASIALLSASSLLRRQARQNQALLDNALALENGHEHVGFLVRLLRELDEELLVLHPALCRGFRVRISGVVSNYQLHTLIANQLVGDPAAGWLPGERPRPEVVAAERDAPRDQPAPCAVGLFEMVSWNGLRAPGDGVPYALDPRQRVLNDRPPADIPAFEGTRVVLLGDPVERITWEAVRLLEGLQPDLTVIEVLEPAEVKRWLERLVTTNRESKAK
jgi:hypothetical protein